MGEFAATKRIPRWYALVLLWTLALLMLGTLPGFGGPSYPYGLLAGIFVGPFGAAVAAYRVRSLGARGDNAVWVSVTTGLTLAAAIIGVALVHGVREGFCDVGGDFERLLLGPCIGALVACSWGSCVTQWVARRWALYALALGLPIVGYLASFVRFYTSPMVFAFDHFAGFFAGTLYDTELGSLDRLWSYRAGTLGLVTALSAVTILAEVPVLMWWTRRGTLSVTIAGAVLVAGVYLRGPALGHYQTSATIAATLGSHVASVRCDVVFDSTIGVDAAALLSKECDTHVVELEHDLAVTAPARIKVFLFASADQKAALMGARHVYVAKPWREEVYINASPFPHPVLRHELVHVVAGSFGQGPFKVAGNARGLVPDPGRIEGIAVMAAPPEDESLTLAQWSAAMQRLNIMPPLNGLFQLGFFGTNSSSAYTVAGAFLEWIAANYGVSTVKAWYGGASLEALTHTPWSELELTFGQFLAQIPISTAELDVARSRFERPAVLQRRCPHQVDATLTQGLQWVGRGDCGKARKSFEQVLEMDPSALRAELGQADCAFREGQAESAITLYERVAGSAFASTDFKTAAWERAGDVAWQQGNLAQAIEFYEKSQSVTLDEDNLRQLDIKVAALANPNDRERMGVERFFFGPEHRGSFPLYSGNLLGEWAATEPQGLPSYLLGKQYLAGAQWALAASHLRQSLKGNLQTRIRREALRTLLLAACATGDVPLTREAWRNLASDRELTTAQYAGFRAIARRCGAESSNAAVAD